MFGTDHEISEAMYQPIFRWPETGDEYFDTGALPHRAASRSVDSQFPTRSSKSSIIRMPNTCSTNANRSRDRNVAARRWIVSLGALIPSPTSPNKQQAPRGFREFSVSPRRTPRRHPSCPELYAHPSSAQTQGTAYSSLRHPRGSQVGRATYAYHLQRCLRSLAHRLRASISFARHSAHAR